MDTVSYASGEAVPPAMLDSGSDARFDFLKELGIIIVPKEYDHENYLCSIRAGRKSIDYDPRVGSLCQCTHTRLRPGMRLSVSAWRVHKDDHVASDEIRAFLESKKALLVGADGLGLTFEQCKKILPLSGWYLSLEEDLGELPVRNGDHLMCGMHARPDWSFGFDLIPYEGHTWGDSAIVLVFKEVPPDA